VIFDEKTSFFVIFVKVEKVPFRRGKTKQNGVLKKCENRQKMAFLSKK